MHVAVAILRLKEGLDCSGIVADIDELISQTSSKKVKDKKEKKTETSVVSANIPVIVEPSSESIAVQIEIPPVKELKEERKVKDKKVKDKKAKNKKAEENIALRDTAGNPLPKSVLNSITIFQRKQKKDTVDVWWLSDDGGLTLLLPVIINSRSNWSETKLRIFCTASGVHELEKEQIGMTMLLSKFRIDYSDLVIITDIDEPPKSKTKKWFDGLIRPLLQSGTNGPQVTDGELEAYQYKTDRYLRLRELLLDHSSDSNLVFMTLPVTRKGAFSASLYMAWLEALTANMPPFLLVRGNQTSVLTFYS
ncbi:hypothetical protein GHT06_018963 [Daphnia sinensis]|uniref:SLC12A transporter C-terminal domain-containing protein n=1 Tax=Daphnia sinensis TaxID=1820382 RepID=A0AAD5KNZ0_9CRUS|nr:hypothetical protein GHT06_018963 [Daphnia sinensis]